MSGRDFAGYRGNPPHAHWPSGARVAVSLVLNIEEGAELSLTSGDERNESIYEVEEEIVGRPDLCMESHFEYGSRAGYWRIVEVLQDFGVEVTLNACARALEVTPWIAADALARGHEIACHGYRWENQAHLDEAAERALIQRCVASIQGVCGQRPVGWHTRSQTSVNTRRLLVEEGGFLYDSNAYNDDLPYAVTVAGRPHIVLPYSFDTNDMRFHTSRAFSHGSDFARYCSDAFDWLWREGARRPKMMSVGLHTRVIGRPGRIAGLEAFLAHVSAKGGAWIARRDRIARHWREQLVQDT
ncbi:MAG: allantoinase PuuE [Candidatus Competibacterales bacterium]